MQTFTNQTFGINVFSSVTILYLVVFRVLFKEQQLSIPGNVDLIENRHEL